MDGSNFGWVPPSPMPSQIQHAQNTTKVQRRREEIRNMGTLG
jgi:hypothetical protein